MGFRTAAHRAFRRYALRGRRNFWAALASPSGVIDVASVIVGVIIMGVLGTITVAAILNSVPWAQEQQSRTALNNVRIAENAARISGGAYLDVPGLIAGGYLNASPASASGSGGSGLVNTGSLPAAGAPLATVGNNGACYVAAIRLNTGQVIYLTSSNVTIQKINPASGAPDTSACTGFPPVAVFPHPPLTLNYASTTFDSTQGNQSLPATVTPSGLGPTFAVTSGTLPGQISLNPTTGALQGPASWPATIKSLAGGDSATCVSFNTGTGACWGSNYLGQLGNGGSDANGQGINSSPTQILTAASTPLTGITKVSMSSGGAATLGYFACALTSDTKVYCWGYNGYRQLGDGTGTNRPYAQPVKANSTTAFTGATDIAVGGSHACALTTAATVFCWGLGTSGQLGYTATSPGNQTYPVQVLSLTGVTQIAARGVDTCAVASGAAYCWGDNTYWQTGDGLTTVTARNVPTQVAGLTSGVRKVAIGHQNGCALMTSGTVQCWGKSNGAYQISSTSTFTTASPVAITPAGTDANDIAIGGQNGNTIICVNSTTGQVRCWGLAMSGFRGDGGTAINSFTATIPTGFSSGTTLLAVGATAACASSSGALKCWGSDVNGELGNGTGGSGVTYPSPVQAGTYTGISGFPATVTITATPNDGTANATKTVTIGVN